MDYYYNVAGFLTDEEVHKVWNIVGDALERQGYNVDMGELSIRVYDEELTENIEHCDDDYLSSLSEGKDYDITLTTDDDYGSKVDALVDSMGVTDNEVAITHRRKDLDLL